MLSRKTKERELRSCLLGRLRVQELAQHEHLGRCFVGMRVVRTDDLDRDYLLVALVHCLDDGPKRSGSKQALNDVWHDEKRRDQFPSSRGTL